METSYPLHKIKVVLLEGIHARAAAALSDAGYTVETHDGAMTTDELLEHASDAHLIGIRSKTKLTPEFLGAASRLWAVGCFCIGTNQVDLESAAGHGITVFNAPFSNTRSVAEKTICEIIGLHRNLFDRSASMHRGEWMKSARGAHEIRGRTLGIIGYGRIGSQVSVLAEAMGMRVLYYDKVDCLPMGNATRVMSIDEILDHSDVVTLHVPATDDTSMMIGATELKRMKPSAYLINNARGSVVDIEALATAMKAGEIAGAAVDVFPSEPKTNDERFQSPLCGVPNVVLTPHIGGSTEEAQRNIAEEVAGKLVKLMNNGSTTGAVNVPQVELPVLHDSHHRILHFHENVPGVLSRLHNMLAELGVNIAAEYLHTDPRHGYVIIDVASTNSESVKEGLKQIPGTVRVRTLW